MNIERGCKENPFPQLKVPLKTHGSCASLPGVPVGGGKGSLPPNSAKVRALAEKGRVASEAALSLGSRGGNKPPSALAAALAGAAASQSVAAVGPAVGAKTAAAAATTEDIGSNNDRQRSQSLTKNKR